MKFLCDRCKTRYTIADDRVRGKVLKIRCKNCANVITVREAQGEGAALAGIGDHSSGAVEVPADAAHSASATHPTTSRRATASNTGRLVPAIARTATATSPPPMSAELAPPPPSPELIEDEWYVSIDGNQSGPFSLGQAQAWVAGKAATDELHCWNDGFDDWLPVEKVSHFRGLRATRGSARPPTQPPPIPADAGSREAPKPLFAATMAALEGGGTPLRKHPRQQTPPPLPPPGAPDRPDALAAGTQPAVEPATPSKKKGGKKGKRKGTEPASAQAAEAAEAAPAEAAPTASNGTGPTRSTSPSRPPADLFDAGGDDDADDATPPPMDAAALRRGGADPEPEPPPASASDDDDDLAIGEVSRVVRIADLAKQAMRAPGAAAAAPVARRTAATPAAGIATGAAAPAEGSRPTRAPGVAFVGTVPPPLGEEGAGLAAAPAHRGTLVYWLAGVLLLVLVGAIVVVANQQRGDNQPPVTVSGNRYDDLGRLIEGPTRSGSNGQPPANGSGGTTVKRPPTNSNNTSNNRPPTTGSGGNITDVAPTGEGGPLTSDDVETMSRKMSTGTQRCWEQAQKKDPFIDAKRIKVTLQVDVAGEVKMVSLSDFADEYLGQCVVNAVKRWKFRTSSQGITAQFTLAFTKS
ncbi:MAG: GYF domain-containing protein [Kofleriaceae bacterium]